MKLLHLDSSVLGANSVSRQLSQTIVQRLISIHPGITVTYRDLASDPVMHLSGAHLMARQSGPAGDAAFNADVAKGDAYIEELLAADILVIGAPMYNFSVPTQLKAWIDRIAVAGKTFRYTASGPEGLLAKGKKAFIATSRGSIYAAGTPAAAFEHQESYLAGLLRFLGLIDVTVVRAEGLAASPESKHSAIDRALTQIANVEA